MIIVKNDDGSFGFTDRNGNPTDSEFNSWALENFIKNAEVQKLLSEIDLKIQPRIKKVSGKGEKFLPLIVYAMEQVFQLKFQDQKLFDEIFCMKEPERVSLFNDNISKDENNE
jgi:hypothetical protein